MFSIYAGSLVGLLFIVAAHLFTGRVFAYERTKGLLLDALTGVAVAYAFIDVFPHLASKQARLDQTGGTGVWAYLAHHAYLMALLGFMVYLGFKASLAEGKVSDRSKSYRHLLLILSMCLYSYLIGYMLGEQPTHRPEPAALFGLAMAAHLLGLNHENRRPDPDAFDRRYRYMLVTSVVAGWLTGRFFEMSDVAYSLWFAYLAGGIISAGVVTELPRVRSQSSFVTFVLGATIFCVLILALEAVRA